METINANILNLTSMKRSYIQPQTMHQTMCSISTICVGSVHGTSGIKFGGAIEDPATSDIKPM